MEKSKNVINYDKYKGYIDGIPKDGYRDLVEHFEELIGKICEDENKIEIDCGIGFVQEIFKIKKSYSKFISSIYLSNYFKDGIKKLILQEKPGYIIASAHRILENGNLFDCSTDDELYDIFSLVRSNYVNGSSDYGKIEEIFELIFHRFLPYRTKMPEELAKLLNGYKYRDVIRIISDDGLKEVLSLIREKYKKMIADSQSIDNIVNSIKDVLLAGAPDDEYVNRVKNYDYTTQDYLHLDFDTLAYIFSLIKDIYQNNSKQKENIDKIIESIIVLLSDKKDDCDMKDAFYSLKEKNIDDLTIDDVYHIALQLKIIYERRISRQEYVEFLTTSIRELLPIESACSDYPEILSILNSDKQINDMSEEEIKTIYSVVADIIINANREGKNISSIANNIGDYLFRLNGPGVTSFIINNADRQSLANCILNISGINIDINSYMLGYGVDLEKLNSNNLYIIFEQLLKLNRDYAIEFVNMVMNMKVLDVIAFINTFNKFVANEFRIDESMIARNDSYKDIYSRNNDKTHMLLSTMFNLPNKQTSLDITSDIKRDFLLQVMSIMNRYDPEFVKKYYGLNGNTK